MLFTLPELPFSKDALAPLMSAETLDFHHGKHHATYVKNLNKLIEGTKYVEMSLEDIIKDTAGQISHTEIFNNAAQVYNHSFFWNCLAPQNDGKHSDRLASAIKKYFGSFDKFKEEFTTAATKQFGSGWAWLVQNADGDLSVIKTANADNPLPKNLRPLLTCDVWEHAYYIDYRNARPEYIQAFWKLVNWKFVGDQLQ